MAGFATVAVDTKIGITGTEFHTTRIEVDRSIGPGAGIATIEGFAEDPQSIEIDDYVNVKVGVGTNASRSAPQAQEETVNRIFYGQVKKAEQNEEGKVTIEVYDGRVNLHGKYVKYTNEEPIEAKDVLYDVLQDAGYSPLGRANFSPSVKEVRVPDKSEIPGDVTVGKHAYGSGRRGEPLIRVLSDLATKLGCRLWADSSNTLHIEPYPDHRRYELKYITQLGSGDDSVDQTKTLVQGGSPASDIGPAAAYMYDQSRIQSDSDTDSEEEREFQYSDDNVITQEEANRVAASHQYDRLIAQDLGEVEVVGNPAPRLFDVVEVTQLQSSTYSSSGEVFTPPTLSGSISPEYTPTPQANAFAVTGIKHVVDATDGFLTTLELGPNPAAQAQALGGLSGAIADELVDKIEASERDPGSPLNYISGFE